MARTLLDAKREYQQTLRAIETASGSRLDALVRAAGKLAREIKQLRAAGR